MTETTDSKTNEQPVRRRSVFIVETTAAGIAVQTALLTEDGKLLSAPAIFPDVEYAFAQVDELKRLISAHFSQAARLGAQVAAQQAAQAQTSETETAQEESLEGTPQQSQNALQQDTTPPHEAGAGRKTFENLKKFVYSGLSQVSKIAQPSSTASPSPENTPNIETSATPTEVAATSLTGTQSASSTGSGTTSGDHMSARKPRAGGKKIKSDPSVS